MTSSTTLDGVLQRVILIVVLVSIMESVIGSDYHGALTLQPGKHPRCHWMNMHIKECKSSSERIRNHTFAGWFYHEPLRSCRPFYSVGSKVHCKENLDLPLTKDECEELCGEKCHISDGRPGICMMEEYCREFRDPDYAMALQTRPCGPYYVKCCPPKMYPVYLGDNGRPHSTPRPTTVGPTSTTTMKHPPLAETTVSSTVQISVPTTGPPVFPITVPTTGPPTVPTTRPPTVPTTGPTPIPTTGPTMAPTTGPPMVSIIVPTTGPTPIPTTGPTTAPTTGPPMVSIIVPTTGPTPIPTTGTTAVPTTGPTPIPTTGPTIVPTKGPPM